MGKKKTWPLIIVVVAVLSIAAIVIINMPNLFTKPAATQQQALPAQTPVIPPPQVQQSQPGRTFDNTFDNRF